MGNEVSVTEISWTSTPIERVELVDPLLLTDSETFDRLREMQYEMVTQRELLSVALAAVERLTAQNRRLVQQIEASRGRKAA